MGTQGSLVIEMGTLEAARKNYVGILKIDIVFASCTIIIQHAEKMFIVHEVL